MIRDSVRLPIFSLVLACCVSAAVGRAAAVQGTGGHAVEDLLLLPRPQQIERLEGVHRPRPDRFILLEGAPVATLLRTGHSIQEALANVGPRLELTAARGTDLSRLGVTVTVAPDKMPHAQGYEMTIAADGIRILAHDAPGAFYAAMTLRQIVRQAAPQKKGDKAKGKGENAPQGGAALPCLRIRDWPDFAHRGVMLDISRDKVPRMETLYGLVDMLAEWKINQFQLYTQHTFAYRNHRDVWDKASPMTGEQVLALDAYCRERFIELVPNQSCFSHLGRWLQHPRYRELAEVPDRPHTICPTQQASIDLVAEMLGELLPHFSSRQVNVCCDETWDLGKGKSKQVCDERGVGRVYLEFLLRIHAMAGEQGRTIQFWGDIIMNHPELIPELPRDVVALEWGYEANHPFAEHGKKFAAAGVPFYVCPGTSTWNAIAGRTDNAMANLWNAAENGRANGAIGYLITDWGDNGHWQHLPTSYLGYAYGAAVSWAGERNREIDLPRALNLHAFRDEAGVMGRLAFDLGNAYKETGVIVGNSSALFHLLISPEISLTRGALAKLTADSLKRTCQSIERAMARLPDARMKRDDAQQVIDEFRNNAAMLRHACRLGIARSDAKGGRIGNIPEETRRDLARELEQIISEYRRLWLVRNRPGGLPDSAGRFERLLTLYREE